MTRLRVLSCLGYVLVMAILCCVRKPVWAAQPENAVEAEPTLHQQDQSSVPQVSSINATRTRTLQPVQEYFFSFEEDTRPEDGQMKDFNPYRFYTHLGTDYGRMGPGEGNISWKPDKVCVDLRKGNKWAGMWHSLAGLARSESELLDFMKCYPRFVRDEFQPKCTGVRIRVQGVGTLTLEIKGLNGKTLWKRSEVLDATNQLHEFIYDCEPKALRKAKLINWVAEPGANLCIDSFGLLLEFPEMSFEKRVFLISYSKLARCYSEANGIVKDRATFPVGAFDSVPASGLFCLATCAAWQLDIVDRAFAERTLRKVHTTVSHLPKAKGLLPHFVRNYDGKYRIHLGTEYSSIDSSIYFHSMLISAQMLANTKVLASLTDAIAEIRFNQLRNTDGYVLHGIKDDGRTPLTSYWRDWGGETALVLLLERMAEGEEATLKMSSSGTVYNGVGFIAEIQGLFYSHFSTDEPDAITGINWLTARRELLNDQMAYFPTTWPDSKAAEIGMYGLSAGEGYRGVDYSANGTKVPGLKIIHPHYILMSALTRTRPADTYRLIRAVEPHGLIPPWGMVENVTADLREYLPMLGSLNASFECISAYHLWATQNGDPDKIYDTTKKCDLLNDAVSVFYPRVK